MKQDKQEEIINNLINGNYSIFKKQIKTISKVDMLDLIEYYSGNIGGRHIIINAMWNALNN